MKILAVGIIIAATASAAFAAGAHNTVRRPNQLPIKAPITNGNSGQSLSQDVRASESWYPLGEQVTALYTIRNISSNTITYSFGSGKQYDIWVTSGGVEVFRLSTGKMYSQALSSISLGPGEQKEFRAVWNQKDLQGRAVTSGWFTIHAQLVPTGAQPIEVSSRIWVGNPEVVVVPVYLTITDAIRRANELSGKTVTLNGIYRGWKGDPSNPNLTDGPPMTRSDWVVSDSGGSMYVSGRINLDPERGVGSNVKLTGKLARTPKGQVYLIAETATPAN